jgi:hypothetical protein
MTIRESWQEMERGRSQIAMKQVVMNGAPIVSPKEGS